MATNFPNTQSVIDRPVDEGSISSTLSTQIIIKVENVAVGAMQKLSVAQDRPLKQLAEIGTDGCIEIVPTGLTTFTLQADRLAFDKLRLPEAFSRGFRFINAQRLPFDIMVIDFANTAAGADLNGEPAGVISMVYRNCWFKSYSTPYAADNYLITETSTILAETAYLTENSIVTTNRPIATQRDAAGVENSVNYGGRRGSLDASGLLNSIFQGDS